MRNAIVPGGWNCLVAARKAARQTRIMIVRMKVAKSALTFATPILAKIAVRAAKMADSTAHACHGSALPLMSGPRA